MSRIISTIFLFVAFAQATAQEAIQKGHAHNDYTNARPLFDALEVEMRSVEVDVWHREDSFIVAHRLPGLNKQKSLAVLYLDPLAAIVKSHNGSVYPDSSNEFILMIDLKNSWDLDDLLALNKYLRLYEFMLTRFDQGEKQVGAVTVVLSGNGGKYLAAKMDQRFFSVDGGLWDLRDGVDANLVSRVSGRYRSSFKWKGRGQQPADEKQKMKMLADRAHSKGIQLRFWASPNRPAVWKALDDAGVDWINVDDLKKFARFLEQH